jgi:hypothetical protein
MATGVRLEREFGIWVPERAGQQRYLAIVEVAGLQE